MKRIIEDLIFSFLGMVIIAILVTGLTKLVLYNERLIDQRERPTAAQLKLQTEVVNRWREGK